MQDFAG